MPMIVGILVAEQTKTSIDLISVCIGLGITTLLLFFTHFTVNNKFNHRNSFGIILSMLIIVNSWMWYEFIEEKSYDSSEYKRFIVYIVDFPESKPKSIKVYGDLYGLKGDKTIYLAKAQFYLQKSEKSEKVKIYDRLFIEGKLERLQPLSLKGVFDYNSFLLKQHIWFSTFLSDKNWITINNIPKYGFRHSALIIRERLKHFLESKFNDKEVRSFVLAMLIGQRTEMSKELKNAFSITGTSHILAVSGMHVGLIYMMFFYLLINWNSHRRTVLIICYILVLLFLWLFAFVTGLCPSVLRATVMFSIILIGKMLNKNSSIYNSLAASAFCLLVYNPFLLFDVGFLLSYMAVVGIVYFQPLIYSAYISKNYAVDFIWKLTSTTLSAQIATLPLILYYFHSFPLYFLVSNLFILPIATLIVYLGILYLLLPISILNFIICKLVNLSSFIALVISSWPNASLKFNFDFFDLIFMSFTIFTIAWIRYWPLNMIKIGIFTLSLWVFSSILLQLVNNKPNNALFIIGNSHCIQINNCYYTDISPSKVYALSMIDSTLKFSLSEQKHELPFTRSIFECSYLFDSHGKLVLYLREKMPVTDVKFDAIIVDYNNRNTILDKNLKNKESKIILHTKKSLYCYPSIKIMNTLKDSIPLQIIEI